MTNNSYWIKDAACAGSDPEIFFTDKDANFTKAKSICAGCPVRDECLAYAIKTPENFGVWGGTTPKERKESVIEGELA